MEAVVRNAHRPEAPDGGELGRRVGVMDKDILPDGPAEVRRRRLYAIRAMERLGLLGNENLIATLERRPHLRWLADEGGARWDVLTELGRIGEPRAFEEAVEWVLERRPCSEQAKTYIRLFRSGAIGLPEVAETRRNPSHRRQTRNHSQGR